MRKNQACLFEFIGEIVLQMRERSLLSIYILPNTGPQDTSIKDNIAI